MIYIHDVLLTSEDEWSQNFNYVSKLSALTNEDEEKWGKIFIEAKLALEQGYPIHQIDLPI